MVQLWVTLFVVYFCHHFQVAVTSIKIDGVLHEFDTVPGVREDVMQIILNIKGLAVKSYVEDEKTIELDVQGPAEVTAGDILTDSDIEIVNPDHYLFTIADGASESDYDSSYKPWLCSSR